MLTLELAASAVLLCLAPQACSLYIDWQAPFFCSAPECSACKRKLAANPLLDPANLWGDSWIPLQLGQARYTSPPTLGFSSRAGSGHTPPTVAPRFFGILFHAQYNNIARIARDLAQIGSELKRLAVSDSGAGGTSARGTKSRPAAASVSALAAASAAPAEKLKAQAALLCKQLATQFADRKQENHVVLDGVIKALLNESAWKQNWVRYRLSTLHMSSITN